MKTCTYCGIENDEAASLCRQCGTTGFKSSTTTEMGQEERLPPPTGFRIRDLLDQPYRLFRCLVVVVAAGPLILVALPRIESHFLAYDTIDLLNRSGQGAILTLPESVWWLTTLLSLAIAFGLYHLSASARMLFTVFTVAFGVLVLFSGVCITSPLVGFLAWVNVIAQGGILVLAYCTPLRRRFS